MRPARLASGVCWALRYKNMSHISDCPNCGQTDRVKITVADSYPVDFIFNGEGQLEKVSTDNRPFYRHKRVACVACGETRIDVRLRMTVEPKPLRGE